MKYRTLPGTDLEVSAVAMGCWGLAGDATWGPQDEADSIAAVHAAFDAGITFFDTAEMYGAGRSERILGSALRGIRHKVAVASKFNPEHAAPRDVVAACERSLRLLASDHIDLYQIHWPSRAVPIEDTWAALVKLRDQGKIRAIGVSNFGPRDLDHLLGFAQPATNQLPYNLVTRGIERDVLPMCVERGVGVLCYSPLLLGLLSGQFRSADAVPEGRARTRHFRGDRPGSTHGESGCEKQLFAALDRLRDVAKRCGRTPADVAVAWLLHRPGVSAVLTGIRSAAHARPNVAAADLKLPDAVIAELDEATAPVKAALGSNLDPWRPASESRYR